MLPNPMYTHTIHEMYIVLVDFNTIQTLILAVDQPQWLAHPVSTMVARGAEQEQTKHASSGHHYSMA